MEEPSWYFPALYSLNYLLSHFSEYIVVKLSPIIGLFIAVLVIVLIALPLFIGGALWYNNRRKLLAEPAHRRRFGVLFEAFDTNFFFWQFVVLTRRSLLVLITVVFYTSMFNGFPLTCLPLIIVLMVCSL
jgi:hypothetical protein